jgi:GT2 family glycosyltransferase
MGPVTCSIVIYRQTISELKSLIKAIIESPSVVKLHLIDNSPTDALRPDVGFGKCEYIHTEKNIGFGAAHNIALRKALAAGSEYHMIINPDVLFKAGTIENITEFMDRNPKVGMLMPKVLYPDGTVQYLCKLLPTPLNWFSRRFLFFIKKIREWNEFFELRFSGYSRIMNVPYLSGCFMALRTNALRDVGLFDEKIFMYGEDTDLTRRIHARYGTVFYPNATITHCHKKESYKSIRMLWIHVKAAIHYFNKWGWFFDKERKTIKRRTVERIRGI